MLNDLGSLLPASPQSLALIRIVANCCELAKVVNEPGRSGNRCHLIDRRSSHPHDYLAHKHIHARNERLNVDPLRARPLPRETADLLCAKTFRLILLLLDTNTIVNQSTYACHTFKGMITIFFNSPVPFMPINFTSTKITVTGLPQTNLLTLKSSSTPLAASKPK